MRSCKRPEARKERALGTAERRLGYVRGMRCCQRLEAGKERALGTAERRSE